MERSCFNCMHRSDENTCKEKNSIHYANSVDEDIHCDYWDGNCEHCNWNGHPLYLDICCDCDWEYDEEDDEYDE